MTEYRSNGKAIIKNNCSVCGKECGLQYRCVKDYVYKIKINNNFLVQCSYTCWRKEHKNYGLKDFAKK